METYSHGETTSAQKSLLDHQFKEINSHNSKTESASGNKPTDECENPVQSLCDLQEFLKSEIPEEPSAQFLSDAAHGLIEKLNTKRKVDNLLLEQFKQAMEAQTAKMVEQLEQHLYNSYEALNCQVDEKLQDLFASVNKISVTEGELETFRESLRRLYQEMQNE